MLNYSSQYYDAGQLYTRDKVVYKWRA